MVATILREDAANDPVYLDPQRVLELQLTGYHSFQLRNYRVQTGTGYIIAQVVYRKTVDAPDTIRRLIIDPKSIVTGTRLIAWDETRKELQKGMGIL